MHTLPHTQKHPQSYTKAWGDLTTAAGSWKAAAASQITKDAVAARATRPDPRQYDDLETLSCEGDYGAGVGGMRWHKCRYAHTRGMQSVPWTRLSPNAPVPAQHRVEVRRVSLNAARA